MQRKRFFSRMATSTPHNLSAVAPEHSRCFQISRPSPQFTDRSILHSLLVVFEDSSWKIVNPPLEADSNGGAQTAAAAHDTTGGMSTKIAEAASIAAMGTDVFIVEAGTPHALEALRGHVKDLKTQKAWMGTLIRSVQGRSS